MRIIEAIGGRVDPATTDRIVSERFKSGLEKGAGDIRQSAAQSRSAIGPVQPLV